MLSTLLSLAACAATAFGAPSQSPYPVYALSSRDTAGTYNASLPNITIFATGGTIAGSANSSAQTTGYQAGALGIQTLLDAVPELTDVANVAGVQVSNVASEAITGSILLNISHQVSASLDDPYCQGVVITHGTDTLEESAFFLDLTINSTKPVVFVGAMRPATAVSADGPENLLAAVTLAGSESAKGRGGMVVLNDRIASTWYVTKTNANALDTFKAYESGFLGYFIDIKPVFYYDAAKPTGKPYFDVTGIAALPQVDVLYGHQDLNPALATAAVASGAKGLVLAGMGAGGWTDDGTEVLEQLATYNGTKVVVSSRTMDGYVEPQSTEGMYGGGFLNPHKARIMLQLGLNAGLNENELRSVFESNGN
ncbi:unnamed protein product [Discula destructiva]